MPIKPIIVMKMGDTFKELGPERAIQFVDMVCAYRRDDIIGIGLDFDEAANPPQVFEAAFKLATKNGLHKTEIDKIILE